MTGLARLVAVLVVALSAAYAHPALACATCFDPKGERNDAFAWSTLFLSLLPLGFIAGVVWWLYRTVKSAPPN